MLIIFSATLFVSAFLLFWVQLMVAKMILPLLGGSPSVWNTCQLFFQAVLLFGYSYSHLTAQRLGVRKQAIMHSFLLFLPLACLPITITKNWLSYSKDNPIFWVLTLLFISAGLPFFVVSTTAPLIQKWFASTPNSSRNDPYFLYAASNLGSILALILYPTFLEPNLSLSQQSLGWAIGYALLVSLTLLCALILWKNPLNSTDEKLTPTLAEIPVLEETENLDKPSFKKQAQWLLLSFIPSSLLLAGLKQKNRAK